MPSSDGIRRTEYLLGGRRVKVSDLISHGLLEPGATLVLRTRRRRPERRATVLGSGELKLDSGRTYRSLSKAAAVAAGVRALDGWHEWLLEGTEQSIDSLRQRLLDDVAKQADDAEAKEGVEPEDRPQSRHERLKEFRSRAEVGEAVEMPVRNLLELWSAEIRDHRTSSRMETELANHGLTTSPHWQKVTVDTNVQIVLAAAAEGPESRRAEDDRLAPEDDGLSIGLSIGRLPSAMGGVCAVNPNASVEEAITQMLLNDYSQLAVMSGRSFKGAVTWRSIAQARNRNNDAGLADAIIESDPIPYDRELIDVIPTLYTSDFVFVLDQSRAVRGIVTAADVMKAYETLARPFFLIGELDQLLRRLISQTFELDEVIAACAREGGDSAIESFDDLTFGHYQQVLENPAMWRKLDWPLDRGIFRDRLEEIRKIRNDVMHFNADAPVDVVGKVRGVIRLVREYGEKVD